MRIIIKSHPRVISNPGIPGEKSLNLKQISPSRVLGIEMTVAGICHCFSLPNKIR